jgi:hypothetical protein
VDRSWSRKSGARYGWDWEWDKDISMHYQLRQAVVYRLDF